MKPVSIVRNARIVRPGISIAEDIVVFSEDGILSCGDDETASDHPEACVTDGEGGWLTPGLVDLHTHGIGLHLYECSPEDLVAGASMLARFGTTCILPTLYKVLRKDSLDHLARLAAAIESVPGVRVPGFHLEGPFLALPGAGADCIPGDLALLEDLLAACAGKVVAMSVSPDTPQILPVIERLASGGILPMITHTRATVEQTRRAIDAGAVHATHFYDVFPPPPETEPGVRPCGVVETVLADPRCSVDFIADGVHVDPMAIRCALAAKGWERIVLITDGNIGAGLADGIHDSPWGFPLQVKAGDGARNADPSHPHFGTLAGSALTMDAGVRNLLRWLPLPPEQVWAMATRNPASRIGLEPLGSVTKGAPADLVLWNDRLEVVKTWVGGQLVYKNECE
jgi:N-acetylglucosamine-6-phosphate deacetylase